MTRYQFLRFLLFSVLSLAFYPLRALAARFSFWEPPEFFSITPVADMQPKASAPTGAVTAITPNSEFYVQDIHGLPKKLKAESWRLKITGKVDQPLTLSLDQIRQRPTVRRIITLSCIGNPVGGYALGNAEWEGISLGDLLDEADPDLFTKTLIIKGADGYHDSIPLSRGRHHSALLAHTMNGKPLPREHGFPLRLLVPGLYGIKQIKWISEIEVSNETHVGYWEKKNWTREGKVKIISRIDYPKNDAKVRGSKVVLRGIAFSGDRGIQYVQVSTDGEKSWSLAQLEKPMSPYSWVFWSFSMKLPRSGRYSIAVRAADLYSGIQRDGQRDPFPSGTSGVHRIQFDALPG